MLKTVVKVGKISNLSDARYCAGMGVQYLGFPIDPENPGYVSPETLKTIKEWVVGPLFVGETSSLDIQSIREKVASYDIDCLEITSPGIIPDLQSSGLPLILRLDLPKYADADGLIKMIQGSGSKVDYILLDNIVESNHEMKFLASLARNHPIVASFAESPNTIHHWLDSYGFYGISLRGGTEIKPGYKDYDDLADILEILETED